MAEKILIIGGTSGIGKELALLCATSGLDVAVTGRSDHAELRRHGIQSMVFDTSQFFGAQGMRFSAELQERLGNTDMLCVCHGPFLQARVHDMSAEDWRHIALCDYALPGILVSAVLPAMLNHGGGSILLFGGTRTDTLRPCLTNAAYAGAKTGVVVLAKSVAAQYARHNVRCNAILPGFVTAAPDGQPRITAAAVAQEALHILQSPALNGAVITADCGLAL